MSQISRPTLPCSAAHGKTWKVSRSGTSSMSDSSIRVKPSIDEPSNMIWPSRAFSNWLAGTSTFLMTPSMSVNWRRRKWTFSFLAFGQDLGFRDRHDAASFGVVLRILGPFFGLSRRCFAKWITISLVSNRHVIMVNTRDGPNSEFRILPRSPRYTGRPRRSPCQTQPTRDDAWALLTEYTDNPSLIKHALAVEAAMRACARRLGEDEEAWGIIGLIHDFDYQQNPDRGHPSPRRNAHLRELGWPEDWVLTVASHADYMGVPARQPGGEGAVRGRRADRFSDRLCAGAAGPLGGRGARSSR